MMRALYEEMVMEQWLWIVGNLEAFSKIDGFYNVMLHRELKQRAPSDWPERETAANSSALVVAVGGLGM